MQPTSSTTPNTSACTDKYSLDTGEMEALENGTAPLTGRVRGLRGHAGSSEDGRVLRKVSWLDQGLGMVDAAVDIFVARMTRWMDDDGGDEVLVLP